MSQTDTNRERLLAEAFVALADTLVDEYDIIELLDRLVGYSVALLGADAAGLLLADPHQRLQVVASSSEAAEVMELLQLQADQGPCLDCFATATPLSVLDLSAATARWPVFTAAVAATSPTAFRSVHALPLRLRGQAIGAMNLFCYDPGPISTADLAVGQALADVATIGILQERAIRREEVLNEQLQTALTSRVVVEQAKGGLAQAGGDIPVRGVHSATRIRPWTQSAPRAGRPAAAGPPARPGRDTRRHDTGSAHPAQNTDTETIAMIASPIPRETPRADTAGHTRARR